MNLIINNRIITSDIKDILLEVRRQSNKNLFHDIKDKGKNLLVTCPFHKNGQENHPSCNIFQDKNDPQVEYGYVKCFTCGSSLPLYKMVAYCLDINDEAAKQWLIDNFSDTLISNEIYLEEIDITNNKSKTKKIIESSQLDKFKYFNKYLLNRGIKQEILDKFSVGFDPVNQAVTFPVWDEHNNLVMITSRSINSKVFNLDKNVEKPVYLLNFIKNEHINTVYVCESQINCLYAWSLGLPAIALFGTGSKKQYEILRKSGIRNYILCFDGDEAGLKGSQRFVHNMTDDCIVTIKNIPWGKDLNDLSPDEVYNLKNI